MPPSYYGGASHEVRPDLRWKTAKPAADRRVVTALTWPFLARYRYFGAQP